MVTYNRHADIANRRIDRVRYVSARFNVLGFINGSPSLHSMAQVHIKQVQFPVLRNDVAFFVDDQVGV